MLTGWAYGLSKKLLEKQCLPIQFSIKLVPLTDFSEEWDIIERCVTVDVGDVAPDKLLW